MSKPMILHHISSWLYHVQSCFNAITAIKHEYKFRVSSNSCSVTIRFYVNEMNFVQHSYDLDENVIADLIRRDQNKLDELKNLILETNRVWGVKFINDNQIVVDNHIFNMKTKVGKNQEGSFIKILL